MRKTLLVAILLATAACGAYRFPSQPPGGTGTVSGQVLATFGCGVNGVNGANGAGDTMCVPPPVPQPAVCAPGAPVKSGCGATPVAGLELVFTNGTTTTTTTTDSTGSYSIELATGTWTVSTFTKMRIVSGPTTLTITAGASIVANYVVESMIRVMMGVPANPLG
ncbi:MAG TPA: hypothetical protein VGU71_14480 [Candidatus Dormibacteraeota bacterium]|nr:hypothetical protein [Candidatus Dormibacteraeota bacterium]